MNNPNFLGIKWAKGGGALKVTVVQPQTVSDPASFHKQCTLYDLCQHKAILNTSCTVHQILRKIQKTCTTYMQNISPVAC